MVEAPALTHEDITSAILAGQYYSSEGPEIRDWRVEDGVAYLLCGPCRRLTLVFDGRVGAGVTRVAQEGEFVEEIAFRLTGQERYIRGECQDWQGRRAWTNPIYFE